MQGVTQKLLSYNDEIGENKRLYKVNVKAVRDEGVVREIKQKRLNKKESRENLNSNLNLFFFYFTTVTN